MKPKCLPHFLALSTGLLAGGQALAGDLLFWQNNSLSYLYGQNYKINPEIQQTVTFEHADGWKYGDNFFFLDKIFSTVTRTPWSATTPTTANSSRACRWARSSTRRSSSAR